MFCVWILFCGVALSVLSGFVVVLVKKKELVALFWLSSFRAAVCVLCPLLTAP